MSFPEPETESVDGSDAKLINRARSEGLIGAASTLISTSSSFGTGFSTVAIDICNFPSLVISDLISLEVSFVISVPYLCYGKIILLRVYLRSRLFFSKFVSC